MGTSIQNSRDKLRELKDILEKFMISAIRHHIISEPKDALYRAYRNGMPVEFVKYCDSILEYNNALAEQLESYVQNEIKPYLDNVELRLENIINFGQERSFTSEIRTTIPNFKKIQNLERERQIEMAIKKNNKEFEALTGVCKGKPMEIREADMQNANPNYYEGTQYKINCATCAAAFVLRLRGFDIQAKGNNRRNENLNYWLSKNNSFEIWRNWDGSKVAPVYTSEWMKRKGLKKMRKEDYETFFEEACPDIGFYIITINWKWGCGGHATILQRAEDGKLYYIEPQIYEKKHCDSLGRRSYDYLSTNASPHPFEGKGILRVDDKLFSIEYYNLFSKNGKTNTKKDSGII